MYKDITFCIHECPHEECERNIIHVINHAKKTGESVYYSASDLHNTPYCMCCDVKEKV